MKTDMTVEQLVSKVNDLSLIKRDYCVDANNLVVHSDCMGSKLCIGDSSYIMQENAKKQLASLCNIPYSYINRIEGRYPELVDINYNTALQDIRSTRLIRTIGQHARAVLSDKYRRFENEDVLRTLLPMLESYKGLSVVSSSLTDERMYLKVVSAKEEAEVRVGDVIQFGALITNSEVGMGGIAITPFCLRLVCTNGMTLPKYNKSVRHIHLGKRFSTIEEYEASTVDEDDLFSRVSISLLSALDPLYYMKVIEKMKIAAEIRVVDYQDSIDKVAKHFGLDEEERLRIIHHYLAEHDTTLYGLVNAVTRSAQDSLTYVRATELEKIGSDILYEGVKAANRGDESEVFGLLS